ncbi:hypothetical protein SLS62_006439 [Diatrype stigma]|uniref:HTH CENPB-type domain-containing protein n=1 Tax=Diatrype stigma TaxID=117547 RepID=A0AAN9V145_9PEZI
MCKFHQENPHVKQTDIGLRFGVERSTVSKTLRYKERWLNYEERGGSPIQRTKGKSPPDIERALAVWVKGMQKKGLAFTDAQMEERAKVFCAGQETALKTITSSWLEKFKQKHGIGGKLVRRASETAIPDSAHRLETESPMVSASQTPSGVSPGSPTGQLSPATSSAHPDSKEALSAFMDLEGSNYKQPHHSQSTTSLSSAVTDPQSSTFSAGGGGSGGAFSPTSQFTFSPEPNSGILPSADGSSFHRPRSQTFPHIPSIEQLEYLNQPNQNNGDEGSNSGVINGKNSNGEALTPKYNNNAGTAPSSALQSPAHEIGAHPFGMDSTTSTTGITSPALRRVGSSNSLGGRSTNSAAGATVSGTPMGSSPSSPTQEDARRAADTLLSFLSSVSPTGMFDKGEYMTVVRLTEKLKLQQQQQQQQHQLAVAAAAAAAAMPKGSASSQGLGGLSRIPEGDVEMTPPGPLGVKNEAVMNE